MHAKWFPPFLSPTLMIASLSVIEYHPVQSSINNVARSLWDSSLINYLFSLNLRSENTLASLVSCQTDHRSCWWLCGDGREDASRELGSQHSIRIQLLEHIPESLKQTEKVHYNRLAWTIYEKCHQPCENDRQKSFVPTTSLANINKAWEFQMKSND